MKIKCHEKKMCFVETDDAFWKNGSINKRLFLDDKIHLTSYGYERFCTNLIHNMCTSTTKVNTDDLKVPLQKNQVNDCSYQQVT